MAHWKLTISYNGVPFHGWQVQPGLRTVQGTLSAALRRLCGEDVLPQGAGRTDTGVHALAQVASFSLKADIPATNLRRALNRLLPPEMRVLAAEIVPESFHARHSACRKSYEYRIFPRRGPGPRGAAGERICSPFLAPFVWDCPWVLDPEALAQAAAMLIGTRDFSAMAATSRPAPERDGGAGECLSTPPNPVKTIYSSAWNERDGLLAYGVQGSGFLHHMVRNLVGTMVEIGRGSLRPADLPRILESRSRSQAGPTAPASGLFMVEVAYPPPAAAAASSVAEEEIAVCSEAVI